MSHENKTRFVILGLLSENPLSGYDIKKIIEMRFTFFWSESYGQIYPELKKLEKEKLIQKETIEPRTGRKRFTYSITNKGLLSLKTWLEFPAEKEINRYEILLKNYFGNLSSKEAIIGRIREFQSRHRENLKLMNLAEAEIRKNLNEHENHIFILMNILFGKKVYQAYQDWCDEALDLMKADRAEEASSGTSKT